MSILAAIGWRLVDSIKIGPLSVSPHGLGIAVGYLLGGMLLARRAERLYGVKREHTWNMLMWAIVGVIVGARLFYVVGHLDVYSRDPLSVFRIWEGGIVLYGGILGGVAAAYPYARRVVGVRYPDLLDAAAPAFPLGLIFGRIGDLVIGDHLGAQTDFFLGYRYDGGAQPPDRILRVGDVVHQTALYDLMIVTVLFPLVLWLGRKRRPSGWLIAFTATCYAAGRFMTDFVRTADAFGTEPPGFLGILGTQWVSLALMGVGVATMVRAGRRRGSEPAPAASEVPASGEQPSEPEDRPEDA